LLMLAPDGLLRRSRRGPTKHEAADTLRRVAAASALLIPLALVVAEAVAPRRMTAIYPLWALALAAPLRQFLLPAASRARRSAVLVLAVLGASPTLLLALSGSVPSQPFDPTLYALCPAEQPVFGDATCVRDLSEGHLPLLHRADEDERLVDQNSRKAALLGFDAATGSASNFALHRPLAPCPDRAVRIPQLAMGSSFDALSWEYFGAALAISCSPREALVRCRTEAPAEQLQHCESGVLWTKQQAQGVLVQ
ncbi:MAG: hypothetical protein VX498_12695, partial [Myxococcota bacterium]|nr:hypothetical protein [Myxococcota bacterium]